MHANCTIVTTDGDHTNVGDSLEGYTMLEQIRNGYYLIMEEIEILETLFSLYIYVETNLRRPYTR
jgi:hypothetical protein